MQQFKNLSFVIQEAFGRVEFEMSWTILAYDDLVLDPAGNTGHDIEAVGEQDRFVYVVRYKKRRHVQLSNQLQIPLMDPSLGKSIECAEGLIEQRDMTAEEMRPKQGCSLAHAT